MDIDIEDNGDGTFSIYYTVKDVGEHTISIKFGGQPIPDGLYTFMVGALCSFSLVPEEVIPNGRDPCTLFRYRRLFKNINDINS